jgi:VWFA-related protein
VLGFCTVSANSAQQAAPAATAGASAAAPSSASFDLSSSIVLDTVIADKKGTPITGLKPEDFTVLDNKQRQTITVSEETAASAPVEAYILIDEINPNMALLANARNDFTAYFKRGAQLPIPTSFVFLTVDGLKFQQEPSRDPAVLLTNLQNNPTTTQTLHSATTDTQAVQQGYYNFEARREKCLQAMNVLSVKLSRRPGRKLVIWVSPGWGEYVLQGSRMSRKDFEGLFAYEAGLSTALQAAHITLFSVEPSGADCNTCTQNSHYKAYIKGPASPGDADQNDLMLQALVAKSGGKVVWGRNDVANMVDDCLRDAQAYYVITYPAPAAPHDTTFHEVRVQVNKPGVQARTRWGYFGLPLSTSEGH